MRPWPLLLLILLAPGALGHAEPFQSEPAGGARLEAAPTQIWVDFTEPVYRDGSWIRVLDQDGRRVDLDDLTITGPDARPRLTVSLGEIPDGAYRIEWQTYSKSDGHTINGAIGFAVGGFAPPATTVDAGGDAGLAAAAARALLYAGFAAGLGALAYTRFVAGAATSATARQMQVGGWATLVGTGLLTLDTWRGTGLGLSEYLGSPGGTGYLVRIALAVGLVVLAKRHNNLALATWLVFAWFTASQGHITRHGLWGTALETLHLVAMAVWLGGLWLFLRHLASRDHGARFTRLAQAAVLILVATGTLITAVLVWDVASSPDVLWTDSWTWYLTIKIALVALMLLLAAVNRWVFLEDHPMRHWVARWRPDWTATGAAREAGLRRTVRFEAAVSALVLVAAGLLMSVSPPAEGSIQTADGLERTAQGRDYLAFLEIRPQPTVGGDHTVRVYITEEFSGDVLANNTCGRDSCVRLSWDVDGASAQEVILAPEGDGWWHANVLFVAAGNTTMQLDVQSAYVYRDTLPFAPFVV